MSIFDFLRRPAGEQTDPRILVSLQEHVRQLESRIDHLEERLLSYYNNRWDAVDKLADYLVGAELEGEYCEFGVFQGKTFNYVVERFARLFPSMRFVALDSFEGLPAVEGKDLGSGYSSGFYTGQFACGIDQFRANGDKAGIPMNRVVLVPGWFDASLQPGGEASQQVAKVAAAWIDCDLYSSTVPVLEFLTSRLSVGTVLLFDDWRCFRNQADWGQQRACKEWLDRNPQIRLNPFIDFGFHGVSFTVAAC
uniref:TylF/MycF family methyltransferase n=1 Tax=Bosea sp. NBC_00436 TaxID=2969620 RepID=A0A9E7ZV79_9HYPH